MQKIAGAKSKPFVPVNDVAGAPRNGIRRKVIVRQSVELLWPKTTTAQRELFDAWHEIAMQVVHEAKASFRLMALVQRFVHWKTGELWPTNDTLARRGGGCDERTIKRDVATYRDLGLFKIELGCKRTKSGKLVRKRVLRLSIPRDFSGQIDAVSMIYQEDHVCPHDYDGEGDHACPDDGDHVCPDTLEDTLEAEAEWRN